MFFGNFSNIIFPFILHNYSYWNRESSIIKCMSIPCTFTRLINYSITWWIIAECFSPKLLWHCIDNGEIVNIHLVDQRQLPTVDVPTKLSIQKTKQNTQQFWSFLWSNIKLQALIYSCTSVFMKQLLDVKLVHMTVNRTFQIRFFSGFIIYRILGEKWSLWAKCNMNGAENMDPAFKDYMSSLI